ncbi:MAG TPA: helix-turn-helix domain-containing protein [Acidimicrobiales bacterium]|nr:helix-turn-helix domain-containing protein [Acidimicrobiales bacterium]
MKGERAAGKRGVAGAIQPARSSALEAALGRVGDRWSLLVVDALLGGPLRFGELHRAVPGIATNVLAQRLRHLEAARVLIARPYSGRPPRYTYELTGAGHELAGALRLLARWGADPASGGATTPEHGDCGTPLDARWWCPTCDEVVDGGAAGAGHGGEDPPVFI